MKVKATVSFSGTVTMAKDEVKDIKNEAVLNDLLKAGYVEKLDSKETKAKAAGGIFSDGEDK